ARRFVRSTANAHGTSGEINDCLLEAFRGEDDYALLSFLPSLEGNSRAVWHVAKEKKSVSLHGLALAIDEVNFDRDGVEDGKDFDGLQFTRCRQFNLRG